MSLAKGPVNLDQAEAAIAAWGMGPWGEDLDPPFEKNL